MSWIISESIIEISRKREEGRERWKHNDDKYADSNIQFQRWLKIAMIMSFWMNFEWKVSPQLRVS